MFVLSLLSLLLAIPALGQTIVYDSQHNVTTIIGTWSSGSQNVVTGPGFAQPANESFIYPPTTGISYSFSSDGYYEVARYRMTGNGTLPNCITGVMNWCHGTYDLVSNGSIILTPFGDGYQQIQDPCAPVSNFIESYNDTELYQLWNIYTDVTRGYTLQMYQWDGSPLPPMWQLTASPEMLPTQLLRNVSTASSSSSTKNSEVRLANAGERSWGISRVTGVCSLVAGLGLLSSLL
ncbi:chaperone for protein-folding within the ER, fungal-domain-containing protein [Chiua virens]|nr:chaperone for protein-folding within the ER, fungal-domain-containing protein [Chiua virens]KAG9315464.1 chaperone for protein-folding within the ER, fungal-domain-containing protein [Chiua virens]